MKYAVLLNEEKDLWQIAVVSHADEYRHKDDDNYGDGKCVWSCPETTAMLCNVGDEAYKIKLAIPE